MEWADLQLRSQSISPPTPVYGVGAALKMIHRALPRAWIYWKRRKGGTVVRSHTWFSGPGWRLGSLQPEYIAHCSLRRPMPPLGIRCAGRIQDRRLRLVLQRKPICPSAVTAKTGRPTRVCFQHPFMYAERFRLSASHPHFGWRAIAFV